MWLLIAVLIIVVLYLIKVSCEKSAVLKDEKCETKYLIAQMQKEIDSLREQHKIDKNNSTRILDKYNKLRESYIYIDNVVHGEREAKEIVSIIQKETLSHR